MSKSSQAVTTIALSGTQNGKIEVATLQEPYGAKSEPVASIGIFLSGSSDEPDWKVHIPKANIDEVIAALNEAKNVL